MFQYNYNTRGKRLTISVTLARASLYPHISSLSPSLVFERSDSLLVCWGDCLMNLNIKEPPPPKAYETDRRVKTSVRCPMAWELDCVGCDVQPIDSEYVAVLGLSSGDSDNDDNNDSDLMEQHFVEFQIVKRSDGSVISSDILPLAISDDISVDKPSTKDYALLSSFTTPRMDDTIEAEGEEVEADAVDVDIQNVILNTMVKSIREEAPTKKFTDQHMRWSVDSYK